MKASTAAPAPRHCSQFCDSTREEREFAERDPRRFLQRFDNGAATIETHASRGALFETFVIGEFLKRRYNAGLPADLFF